MEQNDKPEATDHSNKVWLMIGEVARELGVHPRTVRRWEKEGVIPSAQRRRELRVYSPQDLEIIRNKVFKMPPSEDVTSEDVTSEDSVQP